MLKTEEILEDTFGIRSEDEIERLMDRIEKGNIDYFVGFFIEIDDLNTLLKYSNRYEQGSRGDDDGAYWYDNVVSTMMSTTSKLEVFDTVEERYYEIIIRSDATTGSMVEGINPIVVEADD